MQWTIPNILTVTRIFAAPVVPICFFLLPPPLGLWLAFWLFVVAALTDFLDGWLARKLDQMSPIGKMLDPIADKAMVMIALFVVSIRYFQYGHELRILVLLPAVVIIFREVLVAGLREFLGPVSVVAVTRLAKWKTTVQMVAIATLLLAPCIGHYEAGGASPAFDMLTRIGVALMWLAAVMTAITGWDYFTKGLAHIAAREGQR